MNAPVLLVVEDDPAIRRFIRLSLARLPVRLLEADSIAAARRHLAAGGIDVLLTDLMLADGNGLELLQQRLASGPRRVIVLSAGLEDDQRLAACSGLAWRVLHKPVGLRDLLDTVRAAVEGAAVAPPAAPVDLAVADAGRVATPATPAPGGPPGADDGPDLLDRFARSVRQRLGEDLDEGDRHLAADDAPALCRHAHNLKTVMGLLAEPAAAAAARELEKLAATGSDRGALRDGWQALRTELLAVHARRP